MRSTGFVIVSVALHAMALTAVTFAPQSTHDVGGDTVEITMGEPADHAGVANGPEDVVTQAAPAAAPQPAPVAAPVPAPKPAPAPVAETKPVEKPVEKVEKKPAPVKKVALKHAPAPVKAAAAQQIPAAVTEDAPEAAPVAEAKSEQPVEEEPKLIPVKEMSPAGVQAATADEPAAPPVQEEPVAAKPAAAPTPAPVAAAVAPTATAASTGEGAGKTSEINGLTAGGELGKGGATPAGAVDVTSLRQMAGNKAPLYPLAARRDKRQGEVTLLYRVTREGRVSDMKLENSSGSEDLDAEAMKAIAKYRFVPGQEGWARHPVHFNLKGDTAEAPSRLRTKVGEQ